MERPILFSGGMVRAILDGRKTMTRRVIPERLLDKYYDYDDWCNSVMPRDMPRDITCTREYEKEFFMKHCPYGAPGDHLWVRETHYLYGTWNRNGLTKSGRQKWTFVPEKVSHGVLFPDNPPDRICTKKNERGWFKRPSIFMPRWAARITLEVTGVRVERLKEITVMDVAFEGALNDGLIRGNEFQNLWDSINKKRGHGWDANPWVWVILFKRIN